jgi:hypothetical protein
MHSSGLHFYNPTKEEFSFVVTVGENMKLFSKRQVVGAEKARTLMAGLAFPQSRIINGYFGQIKWKIVQ